jgi:dihydrofolate synthase/folylpolyglutamate synthase
MLWSYQEALDYLYSFIDYEVRREVRYAPEVMNLDRPLTLLAGLGNPQQAYPIVHITGTKGKGSVGAYCLAALRAAGLRTGLYSSPHLQDFRERFRIDNSMIDPDLLTVLLAEIKPVADTIPGLTWFELTTALAFLYFARQKVDAVVLEVGLGGRLDATNVVTPLVSVITSLSYDHTHLLGHTLAEIAVEKAGIIKPGVPVISAPQPPEAADVLARIAAERGAPLTVIGQDWRFQTGRTTRFGQDFLASPEGEPLRRYATPLLGEHQVLNAVVALAALDAAARGGLTIPAMVREGGPLNANWPGRFEIVNERPWMILDAAHNGASAECLRETLLSVFPEARPRVMVFGASSDKDITGMFHALLPEIDHLLLAQAVHPRALEADSLAAKATEVGYAGSVEQIPVVDEALRRAQELVGPGGLILVTGSLFIVGEARDFCGLTPGQASYYGSKPVEQLLFEQPWLD